MSNGPMYDVSSVETLSELETLILQLQEVEATALMLMGRLRSEHELQETEVRIGEDTHEA